MITFQHTEVVGWEAAIRGMRNPLESWEKSDSRYREEATPFIDQYGHITYEQNGPYLVGSNDLSLMMKLRKAGADHRKFMRMIVVYVDITAPLYWLAELDTYKIGTVRNSCSFMHKGVSKPYSIRDFSLHDERIYDILDDLPKKKYTPTYPYETDEYRQYIDENGRLYDVYRNGRVVREAFDYVDSYGSGRKRHFEAANATVYQNRDGYFIVKLSGRAGGCIPLHRMVAECWVEKPENPEAIQVDHIDDNKGNNSAENLEWVTPSENMQKAVESGLYNNLKSLHRLYKVWKNNAKVIPIADRIKFKTDADSGFTHRELAKKYGITKNQANNLRYILNHSENEDLFQECYVWERLINTLNGLRDIYLETKDDQIFQQIRCLMPQGYMQRSTFMLNYEVLANIYKSRKNHKLDEWHEFCGWIKTLPYSELIVGGESQGA